MKQGERKSVSRKTSAAWINMMRLSRHFSVRQQARAFAATQKHGDANMHGRKATSKHHN
jgi:hypothetical protein